MVYVLSHWDDGVLGVFTHLKGVHGAKFHVACMRCETYCGFYKNKWGGWSYNTGGYEIHKMSEDEAEILFRYNEGS